MKNRPLLILGLAFTLQSGFFACGNTTKVRTLNKKDPTAGKIDANRFESFSKSPKLNALTTTTFAKNKENVSAKADGKNICDIVKGTSLELKRMFYFSEGSLIRVSLTEEIEGCNISSGYLNYDDFQKNQLVDAIIFKISQEKMNSLRQPVTGLDPQEENVLSDDDAFEEAMKHILHWEGLCADHKNDPGGRTFMGITTATARRNGYQGDVCKMPRDQVMAIYRKDYWDTGASAHPYPLSLAYMNTSVHSGPAKAKEFEAELPKDSDMTTNELAVLFLSKQTAFYNRLTQYTQYQDFAEGWNNRSVYMKDVMQNYEISKTSGESGLSLTTNRYNIQPTAKAVTDPSQLLVID